VPALKLDNYTAGQRDVIHRLRRRTGWVRIQRLAPRGVDAILVEVLTGPSDSPIVVEQTRVLPDGSETDPGAWIDDDVPPEES
jgi:hypothetical protein